MDLTQHIPPNAPCYGYRPHGTAAPAVSIITPYHNASPPLLETVQSVLLQSLQQWEWIVVNDGSNDPAALHALLPLRSADARIRVLDQPHCGASAACNGGVAASRAPLLFFLNSGDVLAPTALEKLAWTLVSSPRSAFAGGWQIHENCRAVRRGFDTRHAFPYDNVAQIQSMVRRTAFEQLGGFDVTRAPGLAAYDFWIRSAAQGNWGHDIREYLTWIPHRTSQRGSSPELAAFRAEMRARYPQIFRDGPPATRAGRALLAFHALIQPELPFYNRLERAGGQRRILLLIPWMRIGGAEQFVLDLAAGLTARGDRVSVCMLRDDQEHTWLDKLRRITSDIFDLAAFLAPADYPRFLHYLIVSRQITTVLVSNSLLAYQLLPYLRARCPQTAFIDYLHAEQAERNGGIPRAGIEHDDFLDLHIHSSQYLRRWMIERGATEDRTAVCTTNIDPAFWAPALDLRIKTRSKLGINDERPIILFVGRLSAEKRPLFAAEILGQLQRTGVLFLGLVAGDGEDRAGIRRFLRRHGLEHTIRLLGAVTRERVRDLLAAGDILLLPSEREGIALTLFEAMAMGVVPVAADVGGQSELVTPECGILIPHGPDELAQYVGALQRLIEDPARRAGMAQAARARIEASFGLDRMLDRMQALCDHATELADTHPRPPVSAGAGLAAATLAIEHFQLESRLRQLPPARLLLALRWSSLGKRLSHLRDLFTLADRFKRSLHIARHATMQRLGKHISYE